MKKKINTNKNRFKFAAKNIHVTKFKKTKINFPKELKKKY